ncbi:MAG: trypsin-like peptidase domain-containing protein [Pseudoflavonifractor sp.]|nr:trypsin-like peptidase domain-containing protein [Pseudoflavonifractor sp.]
MRRSYYDPVGWTHGDRVIPGTTWSVGDPAVPFGNRKSDGGAPNEDPPSPKKRPRHTPPRAKAVFALFLVAIFALTAAGALWNAHNSGAEQGLPQWAEPDPWGGWEKQEEFSQETLVERYAAGDGTVLALEPAEGEVMTAQAIYAKVSPAVVSVRTTLRNGQSLGTGVILSADGYLITNAHVIEGGLRVDVTLSDNSIQQALLVGYDSQTDLAVLKIDGRGLPTARFGDSTALQVGDGVYAIGNPLGEELRGTMTEGIVSAIDRTVTVGGWDMTLVQTTAALNSGNSGGALINQYGQVVGITNMKMMSDYDTIEGLGFAIPTASAKMVVDQLIAQGYISGRPVLGVTVTTQAGGGKTRAGARIVSVTAGSDAEAKGLRVGDVIFSAQGEPVDTTEDLREIISRYEAGDSITLEYQRNGETATVSVCLMEQALLGR